MPLSARLRSLVVDDEETSNELICRWLKDITIPDFDPVPVRSLQAAYLAVAKETFDAVILDRMLGDGDGIELLRHIRAHETTRHIPVVILSGLTKEKEIIRGLEIGADDYVSKPCSYELFRARLRSVLNRHRYTATPMLASGPGFQLDCANGRLMVDGRVEHLEPKEAEILWLLLRRPNVIHSAAFLRGEIWGTAKVPHNTLESRLSSLRRKLGSQADRLETVRGSGYRILR